MSRETELLAIMRKMGTQDLADGFVIGKVKSLEPLTVLVDDLPTEQVIRMEWMRLVEEFVDEPHRDVSAFDEELLSLMQDICTIDKGDKVVLLQSADRQSFVLMGRVEDDA